MKEEGQVLEVICKRIDGIMPPKREDSSVRMGKCPERSPVSGSFEVVKLKIKDTNELWQEPYFKTLKNGKKQYNLSAIIKVGTHVLMWQKTPDEIYELSRNQLSSRLFVVYKYNSVSSNVIYLQNNLEARLDSEIKDDDKTFNSDRYQARLHLVANNFNCLIEGRDFEITPMGEIKFYD